MHISLIRVKLKQALLHAFQPEDERRLESVSLAICELADPENIISWLLHHCPKLNMLNLSGTDVNCTLIDQILKQRVFTEVGYQIFKLLI